MRGTEARKARGASPGAFDGLRLVAAVAVLYGHCYPLTARDGEELITRLTDGAAASGAVGVYAFFAISGYLVTQSWDRDPSGLRFLARRALRIIPGLVLVIVGSVVLIGPLTTGLSLAEYASQRQTWSYLAKILVFPAQLGLPGTFADNPFPNVVNGSLWSLRVECALYLVVAAMGRLGLLRRRSVSIVLALGCLAMTAALTNTTWLSQSPYAHQLVVLFANSVPFFVGAALARTNLASGWVQGGGAALALSTVAALGTPAFEPLLLTALPLAVILIARFGSCDLSRIGDLSYGIYLWAFPVQQTVVHLMPGIAPLALFAIAGAATVLLAAASWHLIEQRALALKPRSSARNIAGRGAAPGGMVAGGARPGTARSVP